MFQKLDTRKIRFKEAPPANSANPANPTCDTPEATISKISGISNPVSLNSHFCDPVLCDCRENETATFYRERPRCPHCLKFGPIGQTGCLKPADPHVSMKALAECTDYAARTEACAS